MFNFKKIFLILFFVSFLWLFFGGFIFAQETELEYPGIPGAEIPHTTKPLLPQYIKYLFNLAIVIAGIVTFFSLVYGGFRYLTSAGSPVAMSDAKSQITAGILGLAIILGSWLLLTTINPQLTVLTVEKITFEKGIIVFPTHMNCLNLGEGAGDPGAEGYEEDADYTKYAGSVSNLRGLLGDNYEKYTGQLSIYFFNDGSELEVTVYTEENFKGESFTYDWQEAGECKPVIMLPKSIKLTWKIPGVYLYAYKDCDPASVSGGDPLEPRFYTGDTATFGDFDNKAESLKILPRVKKERKCDLSKPECSTPDRCIAQAERCLTLESEVVIEKFGAILFEQDGFEGDGEMFLGGNFYDAKPQCINLSMEKGQGVCDPNTSEPYCREHVRERTSSIVIFKQRPPHSPPSGDGVTLYANYHHNEQDEPKDLNRHCGPFTPQRPLWVTKNSNSDASFDCVGGEPEGFRCEDCNYVLGGAGSPQASSIRVDGEFIAVLFREDGRAEVFKGDDLRLRDNDIGDDEARYMLVIPIASQ